MSIYIEKTKEHVYPVVVLKRAVPFPSIPFRININDSKLQCALFNKENDCVVLATVKPSSVDNDNYNKSDIHKVCVVAQVKEISPSADNSSLEVTFDCLCRAEILDFFVNNNFDSANVICKTIVISKDDPEAVDLKNQALKLFDDFTAKIPGFSQEIIDAVKKSDNIGQTADFIAASTFLSIDYKLQILSEFNPLNRIKKLIKLFAKENERLDNDLNIHKKTRKRIEENQREYYLREQLKVIREELGEDSDSDEDVYELFSKIVNSKVPDEGKEKLLKECKKLLKLQFASPEANVINNYIETVLEYPWGKTTIERKGIENSRKILEKDHYGMEDIKTRILEYLAVRNLTDKNKNQIICLVGAPGVGKTSVAKSIAKALNKKFVRISLGGVRDEADIRGHRKTYIGAMPGRIVTGITESGESNPLILLDEIDKLTMDAHGDPSSALLEVLDPDQNNSFRDHFIEMPIDLSDCMFIATANNKDYIPKPLLDRMEVIEMKSYLRQEKLHIAKDHLIPKQLAKHGINKKYIKLSDDAILEIIDKYTFEAGVRNLERNIAAICRKIALKISDNKGNHVYKISKNDLFEYLGPELIVDSSTFDNKIGIVNGLAYTEAGGDMLKVETVSLPGTGKIELTGSLGQVMTESAKIAVSIVRKFALDFGIDPDFYKNKDIHIHFPEGAVPKDGPSAGVTIVTSLVSELASIPVKGDVAMTGEVSLHGKTIPIGGLREKSSAAASKGIKTILIPKDNINDYKKLDNDIKSSLNFIFCDDIRDVLKYSLTDPSKIGLKEETNKNVDLSDKSFPVPTGKIIDKVYINGFEHI